MMKNRTEKKRGIGKIWWNTTISGKFTITNKKIKCNDGAKVKLTEFNLLNIYLPKKMAPRDRFAQEPTIQEMMIAVCSWSIFKNE